MKIIFDILTDPFTLPINPFWEYLILTVIGLIAFFVGWDVSPGGVFGSIIHWIVRFVAFLVIWAITYGLIVLFQWLFSNLIHVLIITIVVLCIAIVIAILARKKRFPKRRNHD